MQQREDAGMPECMERGARDKRETRRIRRMLESMFM
jgi:hypothetical protein